MNSQLIEKLIEINQEIFAQHNGKALNFSLFNKLENILNEIKLSYNLFTDSCLKYSTLNSIDNLIYNLNKSINMFVAFLCEGRDRNTLQGIFNNINYYLCCLNQTVKTRELIAC